MQQSEIVETRICSLGGQWSACNVKRVGIESGIVVTAHVYNAQVEFPDTKGIRRHQR